MTRIHMIAAAITIGLTACGSVPASTQALSAGPPSSTADPNLDSVLGVAGAAPGVSGGSDSADVLGRADSAATTIVGPPIATERKPETDPGAVRSEVTGSTPAAAQSSARSTAPVVPAAAQTTITMAPPPAEREQLSTQPSSTTKPGQKEVGSADHIVSLLEDGSTYDPLWSASVVLSCGDSPDRRKIDSFTAEPNGRGVPALMYSEPSGRIFQLSIGDQYPKADRLDWAIRYVHLGPWPVGTIHDTCRS